MKVSLPRSCCEDATSEVDGFDSHLIKKGIKSWIHISFPTFPR